MPDQLAPQSIIQNSLAAGEIAPGLYGRTDLAKFHQSALLAKNWFVDYKGGMSTRCGTQLIGTSNTSGFVRLFPFKFSATVGQTYILVFSNHLLEFIKNPGGNAYPNSSNSGFILSGGVHYTVATPYATADLPNIRMSQVGDTARITCKGYPRYKLVRTSDTSWALTAIAATTGPGKPNINSITISPLPAGSTDPQKTRYIYGVSAVNNDGVEGPVSIPVVSGNGIDIAATQGTVAVAWSAVTDAAYYRVYKGLPSPGDKVPPLSQQLGFCGFSYGTTFLDSNIVPDFAQAPLLNGDPFSPGQVTGFNISSPGVTYPVGATTITLSGVTGTAPIVYPILDNTTASGTGSITGIYIADPGKNNTGTITMTAVGAGGSGFAGVLNVGPQTGTDPAIVGLFQQRQIYAQTINNPNGLFGSRPGDLDNFSKANPLADNDAYQFDLASPQVNTISWVVSMPGGLVIGGDSGVLQLTGGSSSASNPSAVTAQSAVIVPQSYHGAAFIDPIVIDYNILYVQTEGSAIRNLQYNFLASIYTGSDITLFSNHLFYPKSVLDWAYQDTPFKIIWCIMSDGNLLSLTYVKDQEIMGWTRHETAGGAYESVAVVQEGTGDAVYFSVNRGGTRFIERMADRVFTQIDDSWSLDAALSIVPTWPAATLTLSAPSGTGVIATASAGVFSSGNVNGRIRFGTGRAKVTAFTDTTHVVVDVEYEMPGTSAGSGSWRLDNQVSSVSGLTLLNGYSVYALVDGAVQGPFTVSAGAVALATPGTSVVVGILYTCQLQPVYADVGGEITMQGRRKKLGAVTFRVKDTARLKYGIDFDHLDEFTQGVSDTNPAEDLPYVVPGLATGDQRLHLNAPFDRVGTTAIEQDYPLPATVLAVIPELTQGDTR